MHQGQQQGDQLFEHAGQVQPDTKAQYDESHVGWLQGDLQLSPSALFLLFLRLYDQEEFGL